jgi:hypothetical protein
MSKIIAIAIHQFINYYGVRLIKKEAVGWGRHEREELGAAKTGKG